MRRTQAGGSVRASPPSIAQSPQHASTLPLLFNLLPFLTPESPRTRRRRRACSSAAAPRAIRADPAHGMRRGPERPSLRLGGRRSAWATGELAVQTAIGGQGRDHRGAPPTAECHRSTGAAAGLPWTGRRQSPRPGLRGRWAEQGRAGRRSVCICVWGGFLKNTAIVYTRGAGTALRRRLAAPARSLAAAPRPRQSRRPGRSGSQESVRAVRVDVHRARQQTARRGRDRRRGQRPLRRRRRSAAPARARAGAAVRVAAVRGHERRGREPRAGRGDRGVVARQEQAGVRVGGAIRVLGARGAVPEEGLRARRGCEMPPRLWGWRRVDEWPRRASDLPGAGLARACRAGGACTPSRVEGRAGPIGGRGRMRGTDA